MELLSEMNFKMEKIRKQIDYFEENPDNQVTEWKACLDELSLLFQDVARQQIFSSNEEFSEIKTEDIKFLLIPFYQAELIQKFSEGRPSKLKLALKFYDEFYKILELYNYLTKDRIASYKVLIGKEDIEKKKPSYEDQSLQRQEKINLYKQKKGLSEKLKVNNSLKCLFS